MKHLGKISIVLTIVMAVLAFFGADLNDLRLWIDGAITIAGWIFILSITVVGFFNYKLLQVISSKFNQLKEKSIKLEEERDKACSDVDMLSQQLTEKNSDIRRLISQRESLASALKGVTAFSHQICHDYRDLQIEIRRDTLSYINLIDSCTDVELLARGHCSSKDQETILDQYVDKTSLRVRNFTSNFLNELKISIENSLCAKGISEEVYIGMVMLDAKTWENDESLLRADGEKNITKFEAIMYDSDDSYDRRIKKLNVGRGRQRAKNVKLEVCTALADVANKGKCFVRNDLAEYKNEIKSKDENAPYSSLPALYEESLGFNAKMVFPVCVRIERNDPAILPIGFLVLLSENKTKEKIFNSDSNSFIYNQVAICADTLASLFFLMTVETNRVSMAADIREGVVLRNKRKDDGKIDESVSEEHV